MGKLSVIYMIDPVIDIHQRTAAIRYHNGTIIPVVKIAGGEDYRSMMLDLLHTNNDCDESMIQQTEQQSYLRMILGYLSNPFRGRPMSHDLEPLTTKGLVILNMIEELKREAEQYSTVPMDTIALSTPGFLTTSQWRAHFLSAAEHAGLDIVTGTLRPEMNAMEAASAAHRIGLCYEYTELPTCYYELDLIGFQSILAIEYTNISLAGIYVLRYPELMDMASLEATQTFFDSHLGANTQRNCGNSGKDHWKRVTRRLRQLRIQGHDNPQRLILFGERASDPEFLNVVRTTFPKALPFPPSPPSTLAQTELHSDGQTNLDPLYAAAFGAAELAKRTLEAPWGCFEHWECIERRRQLA